MGRECIVWFAVCLAVVSGMSACGGGGGGSAGGSLDSSTTTTLSVSGTVYANPADVPAHASMLKSLKLLATFNSVLSGAHVNICVPTSSGSLEQILGTPAILTGGNGAFTLSIPYSKVPSDGRMAICVMSPTGSYDLYAPIPTDLLPGKPHEITAVTVDADSTLLTKFMCNYEALIYSVKSCSTTSSDLATYRITMDGFWAGNPGFTPDLANLSSTWSLLYSSSQIQSWAQTWGASKGFTGSWFDTFSLGAGNFMPFIQTCSNGASDFPTCTSTTVSSPTGTISGSWSGSTTSGNTVTVDGTFTFAMNNGSVTGTYDGTANCPGCNPGSQTATLSGSVTGTVASSGDFSATGGGITWTGTITSTGGSGSWSYSTINGTWSGQGSVQF